MVESVVSVDRLATVFGICALLTWGFLLLWLVIYFSMSNFTFRVHSRMFGITRQQYEVANYCGMGLLKLAAFVLFVVPYVALKIVATI